MSTKPDVLQPQKRRSAHKLFTLGLAAALWIAVILLACGLGAVSIPPATVAGIIARQLGLPITPTWPATYELILLQIRLPRVVLGSLVGAALALAGATFQGMVRNPLAGPYVLGISGGASLGAVLAMALGVSNVAGFISPVPFFAFLGAVGTLALVIVLGTHNGRLPTVTLLLAGTAAGSFFSSAVSIIVLLSGERMGSILFWLMGGLTGASWQGVLTICPYLLLATGAILFNARSLNAMAFGDEAAGYLGVEVERVKRTLLVAASLLAAAAVAVSGVIAFVGLVIPHMVRLIKGPDHRGLLPLSFLLGASFLVLADTLARTIIAPQELPVGAITALCGAPLFIYILRRQRHSF